jgi:DNA primase
VLNDASEVKKKKILDQILGRPQRQGSEYLYESRCCSHHKPKLSVNISKNVAKCWVCDWRTNNLRRVVRRWGNFRHVRDWKEVDSDIQVGDLETIFQKEEIVNQRIDLPEQFRTLTGSGHPPFAMKAMNYLKGRGIKKEDILYWKIGYCSSGDYENRIILPSFGSDGYCNYFTARGYEKNMWPPYLNGPGSKDIIFNELLVDWEKEVTLVEGVFDAIVAGDNAIPLLGSSLREDSRLFRKIALNDTSVLLGLDHDAQNKAMRLIKAMLAHDIEVRLMDTSGYKDIGEMPKEVFEKRKEEAAFIDSDTYLLKIALLA